MVDSNPFLPFISFFVLSPIACSQRSVDESFGTMMREEFVSHLMRRCIPAMMFAEREAASITRHHVFPLQGRLALHTVVEVAPRLFKKIAYWVFVAV